MKTKFKPNIGKGPGGRSSRPQGQSSAASRSKKDEAPSTQKDTSSEKADAVVVESRQGMYV